VVFELFVSLEHMQALISTVILVIYLFATVKLQWIFDVVSPFDLHASWLGLAVVYFFYN
jgi:hypothetical protein